MIDAEVANLLTNVCQILNVVKAEWGESWSFWDEEQREHIIRLLADFHGAALKENGRTP
jgi:hypothetical protein